jgi:predicted Zn-dependent protease
MANTYKLVLIQALLSLTGCAGLISQPGQNVPVVEPVATDSANSAAAAQAGIDEIMQIEAIDDGDSLYPDDMGLGRPAVLALLDDAEKQIQGGQVELAAAGLERALRLEPKNALLWSRLAEIRLIQKNWQQAYVLANKSNSLAQENRLLQRQNWQIIAQAKAAQGDMAGLDQARSRIRELSGPGR